VTDPIEVYDPATGIGILVCPHSYAVERNLFIVMLRRGWRWRKLA